MKKDLTFKVTIISILLLVTFYLSCDIKSPVENVKVIFNTKPVNTIIAGNIINAKTGEPINNKTINISIEGPNKNVIVDMTASPKVTYSINEGFVSFAITNDFIPSKASPAKIILIAKADGFLPTSMPLNIYEIGDAQFTIHMIEINNPPIGTATAEGTGATNSTGTLLNNDLELTATEPTSNAFTSLNVPVGTIIKDEAGNPLTGAIKATIVYCTNQTEESLHSFPGGFSVTTNTNGAIDQTAFLTAGFAAIEIKDGSGKIAASFDPSINITIQTYANTINAETNSRVKEGDTVPVWSYDLEHNIWNYEKDLVFTGPNSKGNFSTSFSTNHLTYWNLDWNSLCPCCLSTRRINFIGKPVGYPLYIKMRLIDYPAFYITGTITDNWVIWTWPSPAQPIGKRALIEAFDGNNHSSKLGELIVDDLCGQGELTVNLNGIVIPPSTEVIIHCEGWCSCKPNLIIRPNGNPVWYKNLNLGWPFWIYAGKVENGEITLPGILTTDRYIYGTWYEGEWYTIGATVFMDHAEIDPGLSTENIVYSEIVQSDKYTILKFRGQLSNKICEDLCK
jgi:hypothetical protein